MAIGPSYSHARQSNQLAAPKVPLHSSHLVACYFWRCRLHHVDISGLIEQCPLQRSAIWGLLCGCRLSYSGRPRLPAVCQLLKVEDGILGFPDAGNGEGVC